MEAPLFDTRHAADELISAGLEKNHANAIVTVLDEVLHGAVAKTSDLKELKTEFKSDLKELKAELKTDLVGQANKTIVTMIALAGVIIAAIKLF